MLPDSDQGAAGKEQHAGRRKRDYEDASVNLRAVSSPA